MKEIATAIQEGAKAYLSRQFRTVGVFIGLLTVLLFFILPAPETAAAATGLHSEFGIKLGRSIAFILGAGLQRHHRLHRDVAGRPRERPHGQRRARVSGCARRCASRSAPAASPACSRWASGCSAPPRS